MRSIFTAMIGIVSMLMLQAQNPAGTALPNIERTVCGTRMTQKTIDYERSVDRRAFEEKMQRAMRSPLTHRDYAVQLHIVRRDDGTGGIPVEDIREEFEDWVNPYFASLQAFFVECNPERYINSTEYFSLSGDAEGDAMSAANNVADVINIYFVEDPDDACGWARFPWDLPVDYIVIANSCATNQSTLVHELGHYFGLYHTHSTAMGAENVTRDGGDGCYNCPTTGDLCCDTPADPTLDDDNVSASCVYTGSATDGCDVAYTPDPTNIMSYSRKACRTLFTPQQLARMSVYMDDDRDYLQTGCPCEKAQAFCQNISINLNSAGNASITPSDVDNGSTTDCGFDSWSVSPNAFDCGDVGPNVVTLTVTDDLGWVSTCQATVTVNDVSNPEILTPAEDMSVECDGSGNVAEFNAWLNNNGGATVNDACGGTWSNNSTGLSDGCGATGSETVTFTYTDPSRNIATTSATFTIVDNTQPSVTCPADIHLPECVSTASWIVVASDACGDVTVVSDPPSGSEFPYGSTTTVIVTVTDACGNTNTCSFIVERDPELLIDIDTVAKSPLNTCAVGTDAHIILGYGGGPTCVTLNGVAVGGHAPYTYTWDIPEAIPAENFTGDDTSAPTFCADFQTAHCVTYTFVVTVTDIHGCQETDEIEVNVLNDGVFADGEACATPQNPKVVVCHAPEGPLAELSLCISPKSVATHLDSGTPGHEGDCLGDCHAVCISEIPDGARRALPVSAGDADPSSLYLLNVTPNPFHDNAVIEIIAQEDTEGRLAMYDMTGRLLATLFDGPMERGVPYTMDFDAGHLPAGMYIAKLIAINGDTKTTPVVLIR